MKLLYAQQVFSLLQLIAYSLERPALKKAGLWKQKERWVFPALLPTYWTMN